MRGALKAVLILTAAVLLPSLAFAQGTLTGTVRDQSGGILPGVTVEASSPALIEKVRTGVTDGAGQYRITGLNPGTYSLTFTLPGFNVVRREGIELGGTATVTIPAEMRVGALAETITVTGETPVVDVQSVQRQAVLSADVIASIPATRAVGSLLNATPGLVVGDTGLNASPTMTFFSSRGGPTNEGRMAVNGMTVAAPFNGGGVSTYTLDSVNVDEVSVSVSGGHGRVGYRRAGDEPRPALGRQQLSRPGVLQQRGRVVKGRQPERRAARRRPHRGARHHQRLRRERLVRRPDQARSTVVLWELPQARNGDAGPGGRRQCERLQRRTLGLGGRQQRHGAPDPGAHDVHRAVHGAGFRQESCLFRPRVPEPLRGVTAEDRRRRLQHARRRLGRGRNGDRVARGESKLFRHPVSPDAGGLERADDEQAAPRGRLQPIHVPRRHDGQRPAGGDLRSDLGDRAVHGDQSGDGAAVRSAGELRLSGGPDDQHQLRQPEHVARLGVVRHGVARPEGRLPGRLHPSEFLQRHSRVAGVLPVQRRACRISSRSGCRRGERRTARRRRRCISRTGGRAAG